LEGIFEFRLPKKIVFGNGCAEQIGEEVKELGNKALLVTGRRAMKKTGMLDKIAKLIRDSGVEVVIFSEVEADPSLETVDRGTKLAEGEGCEVVIGLGGGSALDAAKAIAAMIGQEYSIGEYQAGRELEKPGVPFLAIPTTSGTGSEMTKNSVLTNRDKRIKKSVRSPYMIAAVALVDPLLTISLPPSVTAASGTDALTQAIEAYVGLKSNPLTDTLALRAIELLGANLPKAVHNGADVGAREKMALGSLISGMAFANAGLGAAHGLSHPLGARKGIPHGVACAILLPWVMEFNMPLREEKFAQIALALGEEPKGERAVKSIRKLLEDIEIPSGLGELGVTTDDLELLAGEAGGSSLNNNPRKASKDELVEILRKAL